MSEIDNQQQDGQGDAGTQRLAHVYATSLLDAAAKQGVETAAVLEELDSLIDDVLSKDPQLARLLAGAAVGRNVRRAMIEKAFAGRASELFYNFLLVLNNHERIDLLRAIRTAAHDIENLRHHRAPVHVWSAIPLTDSEKSKLADTVRQRFQFEPIFNSHVDPDLLGGLKLRIGDLQLDDTVRTRLDNLRTEIIARSSYEIQSRRDRFRTQ